jgi:hypothetical protein
VALRSRHLGLDQSAELWHLQPGEEKRRDDQGE